MLKSLKVGNGRRVVFKTRIYEMFQIIERLIKIEIRECKQWKRKLKILSPRKINSEFQLHIFLPQLYTKMFEFF